MDRPELLDRLETQARLGGVSRPTLDRIRQRGELPVVRIGRRVFFQADDVNAYIARQRETT